MKLFNTNELNSHITSTSSGDLTIIAILVLIAVVVLSAAMSRFDWKIETISEEVLVSSIAENNNNPEAAKYLFADNIRYGVGEKNIVINDVVECNINDLYCAREDNACMVDYNITYDYQGGTLLNNEIGKRCNAQIYNAETETFDINNPTKDGYVFLGWTGSNGDIPQTNVSIEKGSTTGDKTYVANWRAETDVVTNCEESVETDNEVEDNSVVNYEALSIVGNVTNELVARIEIKTETLNIIDDLVKENLDSLGESVKMIIESKSDI